MAQLKKILAGTFAVMMTAAVFAGCGSSDSSSKSDAAASGASGDSAAAGGDEGGVGDLKLTKQERVKQEKEGNDASKNVIKIYTWNDEFKSRLRNFYPNYDAEKSGFKVKDDGTEEVGEKEYLKNGKEIQWVTTPSKDNAYQNKLDEDLKAQATSEDKIDMFLVEADYALKYVNGPYVMPVKEVGISDDDIKDQYKYTQEIVTDANGDLEGVTWQATPGLFAYRRDIAQEVLGTDDPEKVQAELADWDKFNATAAKMKEKGYFMLSGYDDSYRTFSNNVKKAWVNANMEITIDDNLMKWVDQTKEYTEKGYNHGTSLWDETWGADQGSKGKVFGFFYSTWGINFTLAGNSEDNAGKKDGLYGKYAVCEGPQAYYWGGTWICAADGTDNVEDVKDIMKYMACDKDTLLKITKDTQDYTNNQPAMEELAKDFSSEFLGGQNHIALFVAAAPKIDCSKIGPYDQGLNESFQAAFKDYFTGAVADKDAALEKFYTSAIEKYPELKKPAK